MCCREHHSQRKRHGLIKLDRSTSAHQISKPPSRPFQEVQIPKSSEGGWLIYMSSRGFCMQGHECELVGYHSNHARTRDSGGPQVRCVDVMAGGSPTAPKLGRADGSTASNWQPQQLGFDRAGPAKGNFFPLAPVDVLAYLTDTFPLLSVNHPVIIPIPPLDFSSFTVYLGPREPSILVLSLRPPFSSSSFWWTVLRYIILILGSDVSIPETAATTPASRLRINASFLLSDCTVSTLLCYSCVPTFTALTLPRSWILS